MNYSLERDNVIINMDQISEEEKQLKMKHGADRTDLNCLNVTTEGGKGRRRDLSAGGLELTGF